MSEKLKQLLVIIFSVLLVLLAGCSKDGTTNSSVTTLKSIEDRGVLKVGVKIDVPGFGYQDPDTNQLEGTEVDLAKKIAGKIFNDESKVQFTGVTAKTRGPLVDNGEVDMVIATFTITEDRKKSYNFSTPYYIDEVGFLTRKEDHLTDFASLDGKRIGVTQNATTKQAIEEKGDKEGLSFKFLEYGPYPMMKLALTSKRIDAFAVDTSILYGYVDEETEILKAQFSKQEYGVTTKKENTQLATAVNSWIQEFIADGTLKEIQEKWGIKSLAGKEAE